MEFLGPIFQVIKCFGGSTCNYIDQHRKLEENVNDLRRKVNDLNIRKQDLQLRKEAEICRRKVVKKEVEKWFEEVERMNTEMERIEKKFHAVSYLLRGRLAKSVCRKIEEVKEIHQQGSFPEGVAVDGPPAPGVTLTTPKLEGEIDVKEQIWECLMGGEVGMIGVCGMGGIGKTTIMKHINNQLLEEALFDKVIWVTVSKDLNIFKIQEDIANSMKQSLPTNELERATILKDFLEGKRYVLILDDVWKKFSFSDVGIPEPILGKGMKVVLTSRSIEVCRSMSCEVVKVQPLSSEESMELFLNHVGQSVVQHPALKEIVKQIVEKCGGLPLAIVTIAGSMKGVDDICEWRNALNELCQRVKSMKGVDTEIFECLMFSYNRLGDPKIQNCFVYCSLYPEDYPIKRTELIEKWIDEGLIYADTRWAMYDRGHSILNKLENNCLLERVIGRSYEISVKMHDVLRDMALFIKGAGPQFYVKTGTQLKELPAEHEWTGNLEKVSLMYNSILEIPSHVSPKCHNLSTLLLQQLEGFGLLPALGYKMIPENFFLHMYGLKVLDLSYTNISNLPNSISNLENLNALVLRGCYNLRYLPSLARLRALKKLDLYKTGLSKVPPDMEMLVNLTYLGLQSRGLQQLPIGILPMFSSLQYLATMLHLKGEELGRLMKLEFISCLFYDLQEFMAYAKSIQGIWPTNFICAVGSSLPRYASLFGVENIFEKPENSKNVYFVNCEIMKAGPILLPIDLHSFYFEKGDDLKCLSNISFLHEANGLNSCYIWECEGIECVVDLSLSPCNSFQSIEKLSLGKLCNLLELVRVAASVQSTSQTADPAIFSSLKTVYLKNCPRMKELFSVQLLQDLQNLEEAMLEDCEEMEKIIASDEEEEENENHNGERRGSNITFVLPKLRELSLHGLPKLKSICGSGVMMPTGFLRRLQITGCPKLRRIPLFLPQLENGQSSHPPSLKRIFVRPREWWESLEWDNPNDIAVLSTFVSYNNCY